MKNILFALVLLSSFLFENCDNLDVKNMSAFDPDDVWNDEALASAYLTDLYATLPGWPVNDGGNADESDGILEQGDIQTTTSNFKYWPYTTIRKINVLLNEIDNGTLSNDIKSTIRGQAYFLRAFHYFKAVVYHGGVPIIKTPQLLTDDLMVPRNTTKECFDFIIEDLDNAISALPDQFTGSDYGRIDKAAALAFKGRVLLFKASPQFNPSNPYGNAYWQEAYEATKAAKEKLVTLGYGLVDNYDDIFMTEGHKEAVLAVVYTNPGKVNGRQETGVRPLSQSMNATGSDQPIWKLVGSYPMADGKQPGASEKYAYDIQSYWENRDDRFYSTIAYNACILPLGVSNDRRQYNDGIVGDPLDAFYPGAMYHRTGFYCRKGIDNALSQAEVDLNAVDWLEIRFAEVLMNYAEAANEKGYSDEALSILKQIRSRAGIEPGNDGMYGLTASSKEEIREAIHLENYIEFAFEGRRFWELRRSRKLHTIINGMHKYGLRSVLKSELDPLANVAYLPGDFNYSVLEIENDGTKEMYVPETYYFFPIAQDEIEKNTSLKQNTGWDSGTFNPVLE